MMNIIVKNLGSVSGDKSSPIKFILLEDGTLLFGNCTWHKDLGIAAHVDDTLHVIGAGVVPENISKAGIEDKASWGDWRSTGYGTVTPIELRESIRRALLLSLP